MVFAYVVAKRISSLEEKHQGGAIVSVWNDIWNH